MTDSAHCEFELLHIDDVKANKGAVELDVKLGHTVFQNTRAIVMFEHCFEPIECFEIHRGVPLVVLLGPRKPAL